MGKRGRRGKKSRTREQFGVSVNALRTLVRGTSVCRASNGIGQLKLNHYFVHTCSSPTVRGLTPQHHREAVSLTAAAAAMRTTKMHGDSHVKRGMVMNILRESDVHNINNGKPVLFGVSGTYDSGGWLQKSEYLGALGLSLGLTRRAVAHEKNKVFGLWVNPTLTLASRIKGTGDDFVDELHDDQPVLMGTLHVFDFAVSVNDDAGLHPDVQSQYFQIEHNPVVDEHLFQLYTTQKSWTRAWQTESEIENQKEKERTQIEKRNMNKRRDYFPRITRGNIDTSRTHTSPRSKR